MRLFDTHAHFEDSSDVNAIYSRAKDAGVTRILAVGGSDELNRNALRTPGIVAIGWDRDQFTTDDSNLTALRGLLAANRDRVAALGEIGLDFHYNPDTADAQKALFAKELALADELGLPVIIHTREADNATLDVIDSVAWNHQDNLRGVIHSFTGSPEFAKKLLNRNFAISFSGIVTFHSADMVRESAKIVPDDRILVETDSPFLAPVPLRGRPCEPAFVIHTAKCIASVRNTDFETFAEQTYQNSASLFRVNP